MVCHEVWGITAPLLSVARTLAGAGFLTTEPDFYARVDGPGGPVASYGQASRYRASLSADMIGEVTSEAVRSLRAEGAPQVGVLGYSMGGAIAL